MQEQIGIQIQKVQTVEPGERSALDTPGDNVVYSDVRGSAPPVFANEYAELKRLIKQKGLLEKQPIYYIYKALLTAGLLAMSLVFLVNYAFRGLYFGAVFAPNHKGMLVLDKDNPLDFLRQQVLTARNVKASPFTDFWYGALNYQIEHHLFPTIPRNKLKEAQQIVKTFCQEHRIPYHETSFLQTYREILQGLHQVSAPLRQRNFH